MYPQKGPPSCPRGVWGVATIVVGLLAVACFAVLLVAFCRLTSAALERAEHARAVDAGVQAIQADVRAGVANGRRFLVDGDPGDRQRSDEALTKITPDLAALRALIAGNADQGAAFDRLRSLIAARVDPLRAAMAERATATSDNAGTAARRLANMSAMAGVMETLATIRAAESDALARPAIDAWAARLTMVGLVASGMIAIASGCILAAMVIARDRERWHLAELSRLNVSLEARVTERTAELARSEARLRDYFDSTPVGLVVLRRRPDGEVEHESVNPAFAAIFDLSADAMTGRTVRQLWPEQFAKEIEQRVSACLSHGKSIDVLGSRLFGGRMTMVAGIDVPLHDETSPPTRVLCYRRDVTEEYALARQVEAHVAREAETAELARVLFSNSPDVMSILRVDHDGAQAAFVYEVCSPAIECLTGLRPDAIIGRQPRQIFPPMVAEEMNERIQLCVRERKTITYAVTHDFAIGRRELDGTVTPVTNPTTGRVDRIVALARDVTDRNRIAETLRQAQKREALGRLTSGVAHDVNNVLAVIGNGYDTIELASDNPVIRACVASGRAAVEHAAGLVRHLLAFARQQPLAPAVIDTARALAEIETLCRHAMDKDTVLTLEAPDCLWPIRVDLNMLQAAVLNLVTNARDASPRGGVIIIAGRNCPAVEGSADVDQVAISVRDNGAGMAPGILARATEPFFTTKPVGVGSGLGLAAVDGFAVQSGGRLRIESTVGAGTVVTIALPRVTAPLPCPNADVGSKRAEPGPKGKTVLLVDDNQPLLRSTALLLRTLGYDVITAQDSDTAFELVGRHPELDLVMTDIAMAGGNGTALADRIEAARPSLPIIFATGFVSEEDDTRGRHVLKKPFSTRDMLAAFKTVLNDARQHAVADLSD